MKTILDREMPILAEALDSMRVVTLAEREAARARSHRDWNRRHQPKSVKFTVGDFVLHASKGGEKKRSKLAYTWQGPKQVVAKVNDHVYTIENRLGDPDSRLNVHTSHLRFYVDRSLGAKLNMDDLKRQARHDSATHIPERVLAHAIEGGEVMFRVQWHDLEPPDNVSWEPFKTFFKDVPTLVKKYVKTITNFADRLVIDTLIAATSK